jgi:serine acetyltransferase
MVGDALRLTALEDGVVVGEKALSVGKGIWLYHNTTFQIGDTTFTYIERDL